MASTKPPGRGTTTGNKAPKPIGGMPATYQPPGVYRPGLPETGAVGGLKHGELGTYTVPGTAPTPLGAVPQGVQYFEGDQFRELPNNPQVLTMLQGVMIQTGFLNPKGVTFGSPDPKTMAAFHELLKQSNIIGTDWHTTLNNRLASTGADSSAATRAAQTPALVISLANPDDIKATAQKTAQTLLGQDLPPDELDRFVQSFQASQTAAQTADYNAKYGTFLSGGNASGPGGGGPTAGGTTTQEAQTEAGMGRMAAKQIEQQHPGQIAAYGFGSQVMSALDSLRSSGNLPSGGAGLGSNAAAAGLQ